MSHHHHAAAYAYPPSQGVHAWPHAVMPLHHVASMFGGGGGIGHMILSGVVHFAVWRILSVIFRALGPFGIAACVVFLVVAWLLSRRRAYR